MFKDISNFNNLNDYVPILNGAIFADLLIIFIVYYTRFFNSKYLMKWYETYRLSAVIADVLILVIGLVIARFLYKYFFTQFSVIKFIGLVLVIQIIHDILFYVFFKSVPRGMNKMLDLFKDYAKEVSAGAIAGDSFMIAITALASMFFANYSEHTNLLYLIGLVYMIPYILYTK